MHARSVALPITPPSATVRALQLLSGGPTIEAAWAPVDAVTGVRFDRFAFTALDRIAVTKGPGSFTGLRVGIAAARGIAR